MHDEYSRQSRGSGQSGTAPAHIQLYVPVLRAVIRQPGITINELARQSQMPKSGVSVMMSRLVQMGIVRKEADPHDSRLVRLSLTPEGRRRVQSWRAANRRALVRTLKDLSGEQVTSIVTGLQVLLSALGREKQEPC
jgi:DNA-binding MarR family transcriptional regulator